MFARTENPSDSKISQNYLARVHETSSILLASARAIRNDGSKSKTNDLSAVIKRIQNLISLINAEKFNFEDLDAWRMGSIMERRFRDHWKIRSDEIDKFRTECKQKIDAGIIQSLGDLFEKIDSNQNRLIEEETTTINSINEAELETFYKHKLLGQLRDQIENHSRDMKNTLERDFKRHLHNIAKETGEFSEKKLEKKILDTIERMDALNDQYHDDRQLNIKFEKFWESEDVIGSAELQQLRDINIKSYKEQKIYYRRCIKQGFETAFEPESFDVTVKQEFQFLDSLENWKFTLKQLLAIKVMKDSTYFDLSYFARINQSVNPFATSYDLCMAQIHNRFTTLIDENPYTAKNYDGDVDYTKIRDLCISFRKSIQIVTDDHDITKYVRPIFMVRCIAFASKMLWERIIENSSLSELKNDPVNQLNEKKLFYQKLYKMKLSGAHRSKIWQQHIEEFMKEALVQIYLKTDESYATHDVIDEFIRDSSRNSQRKSLRVGSSADFCHRMYSSQVKIGLK